MYILGSHWSHQWSFEVGCCEAKTIGFDIIVLSFVWIQKKFGKYLTRTGSLWPFIHDLWLQNNGRSLAFKRVGHGMQSEGKWEAIIFITSQRCRFGFYLLLFLFVKQSDGAANAFISELISASSRLLKAITIVAHFNNSMNSIKS